jgi:hypothetical protein
MISIIYIAFSYYFCGIYLYFDNKILSILDAMMINMPNCAILHALEILCRSVRKGTYSSHFGRIAHVPIKCTEGLEHEEVEKTRDTMKKKRNIL